MAFAWGEVLTQRHPLKHIIGSYSTPLGAKKALKGLGDGTMAGVLEPFAQEIPPAHRQIGDIVVDDTGVMPKTALVASVGAHWLGETGFKLGLIPPGARFFRFT